ncbi:MAG: hypothetical protein HQ558_01440, partial [Candidatus Omnitrophica bacterium]|nr:hypothetical protein [Candidatus Omnitrophota bacterium]
MPEKTFQGGIHPQYFKELSRNSPVKVLSVPDQVIIPLRQHTGGPCRATVGAGDSVKVGTLIGDSPKFISAPIHSSVSGTVKAIRAADHPVLEKCNSVVIDSDGRDEMEAPAWTVAKEIGDLQGDAIRNIIRGAGIVGLGGAGFPTHAKLLPPKSKPIDTFILNGVECEPYLTCDERIMIERPGDVLGGVLLMMKVIGVEKGIIAIEDNKPEAIEAMTAALDDIRHTAHGSFDKAQDSSRAKSRDDI